MKNILVFLVIGLLTAACAPVTEPATLPPDTAVTSPPIIGSTPHAADTQTAPPFSPLPNDANLQRGNVFVSKSELLIRESYPVQIALVLGGERQRHATNYV